MDVSLDFQPYLESLFSHELQKDALLLVSREFVGAGQPSIHPKCGGRKEGPFFPNKQHCARDGLSPSAQQRDFV